MKKCYIVGAGECEEINFIPEEQDYVIAADGGVFPLLKNGIKADLLIGDFDSLEDKGEKMSSEKGAELRSSIPAVITLPKEKDDTDMLAAVKEGIKAGCREFHLYGGTGGRPDHTIANIQTLAYLAARGLKGYLYGRGWVTTLVKDGSISFDEEYTGYISVFSYTERARGVTIQGLKYELAGAELTNTFPVGTSNEFIGKKSRISVKKGCLLITFMPH